jgi:MFS family permease
MGEPRQTVAADARIPLDTLAAEAAFRREIVPWGLLGLTLGLVEGATAAVLIKKGFANAASPWAVNLAVALVSGAPALSNVVSFVWANIAHGRSRVQLLVVLQAAFAIVVGLIGLAPRAAGGLLFAVLSILAARVIWAGVLTVRVSVWTANYPRNAQGRFTGRIVVVGSLAMAAAAALASLALDSGRVDSRWLFAAAAIAGLAAAWLYRKTPVRREFNLLAEENAAVDRSEPFSLGMLLEILRADRGFREYMLWMGIYGGGNLMLTSQLVVLFSEYLHLPASTQIAMLSIVPFITMPLFVPFWARRFDGGHIVEYRAQQGWVLVAAVVVIAVATFMQWIALLWVGAFLIGVSYAGANLGWNLGHNDFAALGRAQHYMGVHVTLTGVRGAIAPPVGILVYELLERFERGMGRWSLVLPVLLTTLGAYGFTRMRAQMRRAAA